MIVGLQFATTAIGGSISPLIFGMIADKYDIYTGFLFLAGTIIFANLLIFFMPDRRQPEPAPVRVG